MPANRGWGKGCQAPGSEKSGKSPAGSRAQSQGKPCRDKQKGSYLCRPWANTRVSAAHLNCFTFLVHAFRGAVRNRPNRTSRAGFGNVAAVLPQSALEIQPAGPDARRARRNRNLIGAGRNDSRTKLLLLLRAQLTANRPRLFRHFVGCWGDIVIRSPAVLHGAGMPGRIVPFFIALPFLLGLQIWLVIGRQDFDLRLVKVHSKIPIMLGGGVQPVGGNQEFLMGKPAAGIHDYVADGPGGMVKNHVVNLSEFLVVAAINVRAANVIRRTLAIEAVVV